MVTGGVEAKSKGTLKVDCVIKIRDMKVSHAVNIGSNHPFFCSLSFIKLPS